MDIHYSADLWISPIRIMDIQNSNVISINLAALMTSIIRINDIHNSAQKPFALMISTTRDRVLV